MAKQAEYVRYTIRVPADLYARVQEAAGEKSVNAEIVAALAEKYPGPMQQPIGRLMREVSELSAITDSKEQKQAVEEANRELKRIWPGMEFVLMPSERTGRPIVQLNWGDHAEEVKAWLETIPTYPSASKKEG